MFFLGFNHFFCSDLVVEDEYSFCLKDAEEPSSMDLYKDTSVPLLPNTSSRETIILSIL